MQWLQSYDKYLQDLTEVNQACACAVPSVMAAAEHVSFFPTSPAVSLDMLDDLEDTVSHIAQGLHKDSIKVTHYVALSHINVHICGWVP